MNIKAKSGVAFTGKNFIWCLVAWFFVCTFFYVFAHVWEGNRRQKLINTGVSISKEISSQAGLPLLEKDINLLSRFIEKITQKPEVVFASIIDHKNKIIAYTDQEQFFTLNKQGSYVFDNVQYWRISNPTHQGVMNFSSEVTFSDTRVGEVCISLAADNLGVFKRFFLVFALLTLLAILFLFGFVNYQENFPWVKTLNSRAKPLKKISSRDLGGSEMSCPLCGNHQNFSLNGFQTPDLTKFPVLRLYSKTNTPVLLEDLAKVEGLNRLKQGILVQCIGIINKLAAE